MSLRGKSAGYIKYGYIIKGGQKNSPREEYKEITTKTPRMTFALWAECVKLASFRESGSDEKHTVTKIDALQHRQRSAVTARQGRVKGGTWGALSYLRRENFWNGWGPSGGQRECEPFGPSQEEFAAR